MENLLSVEGLTKSYGERILFEDLNFGIQSGQRIALVARNGSGKTSIFRILEGTDQPDRGRVVYRNGIKIGFLPQEPDLPAEKTILEALFESDTLAIKAIREYEEALENPEDVEAIQKAYEKVDKYNAWDAEARIKQMLGKLEIYQLKQRIHTLSGGQLKRVALAKLLVEEPDLLMLDEPTNHLDLDMIEWLEGYLTQSGLSLFMVTHDRYFLDNVCNEIMELDAGVIYRYQGNYAYFLEKKAERLESEASHVEKAKNTFRRELEWMRRQPKARGTKSKARIDAFHDVKKDAHKRIGEKDAQIEVKMTRLGAKTVEFHQVAKAFDQKQIIAPFSYNFKRRERIGIVGKNGTGKSTFLKLMTGVEKPDAGKVVIGETVEFGFYRQEGIQMSDEKRVIEVVKEIAEVIPMPGGKKLTAAQLLERFLFDRKQQYAYVRTLSGGERRRLYLLTILMKNPNFLILDEPTNDLDIVTLQVLEDFLLDFSGCLIIVSHDRHFLDKLCEHIFVFQGEGKIKDYNGSYSEYRIAAKEEEKQKKEVQTSQVEVEKPKNTREKRKLSYNEQREFDALESEIERLETRKEEIAAKFEDFGISPEEMESLSRELNDIATQLETKTDRWLELSEYVD
jgi:ATP-binding cassette subfamily F protein uup